MTAPGATVPSLARKLAEPKSPNLAHQPSCLALRRTLALLTVVTFVAYLILDYVRLLLVIVCTLSMTFSLYLYFNYLSTYV